MEILYYITRLHDGVTWGYEDNFDQPLDFYNDSPEYKVEEL